MVALELLFWVSAATIGYTYLGYPFVLLVAKAMKRKIPQSYAGQPTVSLIVPAYNEEQVIGGKIENAFNLSYPTGRLELIVVSDGSVDGTDRIIEEVGGTHVIFLRCPERRGKAHALNLAVSRARGEVLIFTDANVFFEPDAIEKLVRNFGDPTVGAVVGCVLLLPEGSKEPPGEGLYMRYERYIHKLESDLSTMVSVDGAMFAMRKALFAPLPDNVIVEDFVAVMQTVVQGYRVRFEPEALGYEAAAATVREEFRRKARIIAGGYQAIIMLRSLLNPLQYPLITFQLISHKLIRWLVPVLLLIALLNLSLLDRPIYRIMLGAQGIFFSLALAALMNASLRRYYVFYLPYYFCAINLAALIGLVRFMSGGQTVLWEKVSR